MNAEAKLDAMAGLERSVLLYLESRAVDHGGLVDAARMNAADFKIARGWSVEGLIRFSRIPSGLWDQVRSGSRHVVELSDEAWQCAALERRRRGQKAQHPLVRDSLAYFDGIRAEASA